MGAAPARKPEATVTTDLVRQTASAPAASAQVAISSTAKLAAAFAARHGAGNLGLITLDAYRVAAHEQLRTYGRILGVPVHTAHDRASLEDLLDLLAELDQLAFDSPEVGVAAFAGGALAARLSENPANRILLLEAGARSHPYSRMPLSSMLSALNLVRGNSCTALVWRMPYPHTPRGTARPLACAITR